MSKESVLLTLSNCVEVEAVFEYCFPQKIENKTLSLPIAPQKGMVINLTKEELDLTNEEINGSVNFWVQKIIAQPGSQKVLVHLRKVSSCVCS